jgi:hypothetical protein
MCLAIAGLTRIAQAECALTGNYRPAMKLNKENATRLNYPSLETGGARECSERKGLAESGLASGVTDVMEARPDTSSGAEATSPLSEVTWHAQAHRGD